MVSDSQSANKTFAKGLWYHIGARLRTRRAELGLGDGVVAAHLGVQIKNYQQFETGHDRIPAALLLQASELFKVPLSYFFQDLPFSDDVAEPAQEGPAPVYAVATIDDQLAGLARDFLRSSRQEQSYLLLLARAFAEKVDDR
jgi:transcriptional regulator with XRE-family HTH domain